MKLPNPKEFYNMLVFVECPRKPNLLPVCLLVCRVFDLAGRLDRFENVDIHVNN